MSGTMRRMGLASVLALSALSVAAAGCDDDDDNNDTGDGDTGDGDTGDGDTGDGDGDLDASVGLSCGEGDDVVVCESVDLASLTLDACCVEDNGACGLDMRQVGAVTDGLFTGCVERNQPTAPANKETSDYCTAFWEQIDPPENDGGVVDPPNGFTYPVDTLNTSLSFAGCCRLNDEGEGECGFSVNTVLEADVNFGCLSLDNFRGLFDSDAEFQQVKASAVCDPTTGEAPGSGDGGTDDAGTDDAGTDDAGVGDAGDDDAGTNADAGADAGDAALAQ